MSCHSMASAMSAPLRAPQVFALFDQLCLLGPDGTVVYFGDADSAVHVFSAAGLPVPPLRNPAEHFLRCINKNFAVSARPSTRSCEPLRQPATPCEQLLCTSSGRPWLRLFLLLPSPSCLSRCETFFLARHGPQLLCSQHPRRKLRLMLWHLRPRTSGQRPSALHSSAWQRSRQPQVTSLIRLVGCQARSTEGP
jgi:hypothetical protein